jgi:predicted ferric reductase
MALPISRSFPSSPARSKPAEPGANYRVIALLLVDGLALLLLAIAWLTGNSLSPLTWYLVRSSGISLYLLLWASMMFGLGMTTGAFDRFPGRPLVLVIHRFSTELAYSMLALHLFGLVLDSYVSYGIADILVPFHAANGDLWTALGVIAAWSMIVIGVSFSLRNLIGQRAWRWLHFGSFPLYLIALYHGLGAGTDSQNIIVFSGYLLTLGAVFFLTSYRILQGKQRSARPVERSPRSTQPQLPEMRW